MPEEIMLDCQQCGEPFVIRLGQSATFICPACEGRKPVARVQTAMSQAKKSDADDSPFGLLEALIPFCSFGGLALVGFGGYLALRDDSGLVGGVTWIALGILNLIAAQAGAVLLALEQRSRTKSVPKIPKMLRERRPRHRSHRRLRIADGDTTLPNAEG